MRPGRITFCSLATCIFLWLFLFFFGLSSVIDGNYISSCHDRSVSRSLDVGGEGEGVSLLMSVAFKQPTYKRALVLMTHNVETARLSASVSVVM